jgi:hypothetical protein
MQNLSPECKALSVKCHTLIYTRFGLKLQSLRGAFCRSNLLVSKDCFAEKRSQ